MTDITPNRNEQGAGDDAVVTSLLRRAYAAPTDAGYWTGLEQRIMARLNDTPVTAWWSVLAEWRTAGAVAATIGLLLAGGTVVREVALEREAQEVAARAALEAGMPADEATFSYGGRSRLPADAPERFLDPFDY